MLKREACVSLFLRPIFPYWEIIRFVENSIEKKKQNLC